MGCAGRHNQVPDRPYRAASIRRHVTLGIGLFTLCMAWRAEALDRPDLPSPETELASAWDEATLVELMAIARETKQLIAERDASSSDETGPPLPVRRPALHWSEATLDALMAIAIETKQLMAEPRSPASDQRVIPAQKAADEPSAPTPRLNTTGRAVDLQVPFKDGGREIGSVLVRIDEADNVSVDAAGVLPLLENLFDQDVLDSLSDAAVDGRLTPASFEAAGLDLAFDPGLLELQLMTPVDRRRDQVVSLASERQTAGIVENASDIAAYVNIFTGVTHTEGERTEDDSDYGAFDQFLLDLETSVSAFGPVLESEFSYEDDELNGEGAFFRTGTRVIIDDQERANRYAAGDLLIAGRGFQDSLDILGVGIARRYALQPGRNVRPTGRREFTIERASNVDVVVNGRVLRRLRLDPGTYDLRDIPLANGGNDIELVIEDDAGAIERIDFSSYYDFSLLAPGEVDFGMGAGIASDAGSRSPDYLEDEPVASVYVRTGLSPSLTAGVNGQIASSRRQAGIEMTVPLIVGNLAVDAAGSHSDDVGYGAAFGLDYAYIFGSQDPLNRSLVFSAEAVTADFDGVDPEEDSDLDDQDVLNDRIADLSLNYSQSLIASMRGSLGGRYSFGRGDEDDRASVNLGLFGPLGRSANWSLRSEYRVDDDSDTDAASIFASIRIPLSFDQDVSFSFDSRSDEVRGDYAYQGGSRVGSLGASLGVARSGDEDFSVDAGADYIGNRFRAAIDHDTRFVELDGDDRTSTTRVRAETAIAFADGQVAVGRPVAESFAILSAHPTLEDRTVFADPTDNGDLATSGWLGPALVPTIGTYGSRRLDVDVDDLPPGYDLGAGAFTLEPRYGSGYALEVGSAATVTAMGTLEYDDGEPVALVAGQAHHRDDESFEPVLMFTNRAGRFAISGLKPGPYQLKLNDAEGTSIDIDIPDDAIGLHRAGVIVLPREGKQR